MGLLDSLGLKRSAPNRSPAPAPDADAVHRARLAVEAELAREEPKIKHALVRRFVEDKSPDLARWLPAGSGLIGVRTRKLASGASHQLTIGLSPTAPQTTAGAPDPDGSLQVGINVDDRFRVDGDRIAKALVIGKLSADRKTIRALIDREVTRRVAAQLMHELTHAAIRFENALPFDQQTKLSHQPTSTMGKLREHQAGVGRMRNQKLIFDLQAKLEQLLRAAGVVPTKEALKEHEQRLIEEKFAADQGEGVAEVAFDNLELAKGTLSNVLASNPDLDERRRSTVIDQVAPALAALYDEMDAIRLR